MNCEIVQRMVMYYEIEISFNDFKRGLINENQYKSIKLSEEKL
jgi:hypothetical protein